MGSDFKRSRLWVDPPFQARLLLRLGLYFLLYTFLLWHLTFACDLLAHFARDGQDTGIVEHYIQFFAKHTPLLFAMVVVLPSFLYNMLKFSHRVAGPLFRCRRIMQEMAKGQVVPEFKPRKHDLMRELFDAFNLLIKTCNARAAAGGNGCGSHGNGAAPRIEEAPASVDHEDAIQPPVRA
jgi:hypothetical protein